MPKTAPKTQCRYRFTALQAHTILCLQLPLPLKRFRFYSAAAKNDTLTIHRQLGMEMGAKGTHRYDGDVAAAAAVIIMVYLLLLWWWVSRWQRPISQLFGMIMKRCSMHTVVGAFASSITTTTIAAIATDIQINIASAKTHKMAKREERKTSREGKRWIETKKYRVNTGTNSIAKITTTVIDWTVFEAAAFQEMRCFIQRKHTAYHHFPSFYRECVCVRMNVRSLLFVNT